MGILPQSRIQLYLDASRAGDLQSAYDLLHARSAQDGAGGGKRRTEDGFAGSALLHEPCPYTHTHTHPYPYP